MQIITSTASTISQKLLVGVKLPRHISRNEIDCVSTKLRRENQFVQGQGDNRCGVSFLSNENETQALTRISPIMLKHNQINSL